MIHLGSKSIGVLILWELRVTFFFVVVGPRGHLIAKRSALGRNVGLLVPLLFRQRLRSFNRLIFSTVLWKGGFHQYRKLQNASKRARRIISIRSEGLTRAATPRNGEHNVQIA